MSHHWSHLVITEMDSAESPVDWSSSILSNCSKPLDHIDQCRTCSIVSLHSLLTEAKIDVAIREMNRSGAVWSSVCVCFSCKDLSEILCKTERNKTYTQQENVNQATSYCKEQWMNKKQEEEEEKRSETHTHKPLCSERTQPSRSKKFLLVHRSMLCHEISTVARDLIDAQLVAEELELDWSVRAFLQWWWFDHHRLCHWESIDHRWWYSLELFGESVEFLFHEVRWPLRPIHWVEWPEGQREKTNETGWNDPIETYASWSDQCCRSRIAST